MGKLILVGGGARSGKTRLALSLAESLGKKRVFVATAQERDDEMRIRIQRHQKERGDRYRTVEAPVKLVEAIKNAETADVIVVDCLTLWLSNLMESGLDDSNILSRVRELVEATAALTANVILASSEVGLGLVAMTELGRRFQDLAGWAHQAIAPAAREVYLTVLGCVLQLKPTVSPRDWPISGDVQK